jgi:hypothetical protein
MLLCDLGLGTYKLRSSFVMLDLFLMELCLRDESQVSRLFSALDNDIQVKFDTLFCIGYLQIICAFCYT